MSEIPVDGVTALDHTADVGFEVDAPGLEELLERAGLGLAWLLTETEPAAASSERTVRVEGRDTPSLLRAFLREILHLQQDEGLLPAAIRVDDAREGRATVTLGLGEPDRPVIREIKGVTLHRLAAERRGGRWWGRVIFDV